MSDSQEQDVQEMQDDDADSPGATSARAQVDDPWAEIENLRAEKQALYEKLARVQADYQNSQRRLEKEMDQRLKVAAGHLVRAFLPVVDNLARAIDVPETPETAGLLQGVRSIYEQWMDVLNKNGVEPIAPEAGTPFDPTRMEALMQEPADYDAPAVTRLLQRGYTFEGRVLRPAQVAVSTQK